jgi:hypothetical protein
MYLEQISSTARLGVVSRELILLQGIYPIWNIVSMLDRKNAYSLHSALAGKAANGGKNGWSIIDPTSALDNEGDLLLAGSGIDMAGVTQIPICSDSEAFDNWNHGHTGANFPCNS